MYFQKLDDIIVVFTYNCFTVYQCNIYISTIISIIIIKKKSKKKIKVYYTLYVVPYLLYTMYNLTNFYIISGKL